MAKESKIAWTDATFNPWWGCTKVSPGCVNCYAETFAKRTGHDIWGNAVGRRFFGDKHWADPLKWDAEAKAEGVRKRVFCASMADVFESNALLDDSRARLWTLMEKTPNLDWLLLTKRPENVRTMTLSPGIPGNAWVGTSIENQEQADKRLPILLGVDAKIRWLSCEPLIGPVKLGSSLKGIQWVIVGGESGPGFRPMQLEWARSIMAECREHGVAFFMKQIAARVKDETAESIPADLRFREWPLPAAPKSPASEREA